MKNTMKILICDLQGVAAEWLEQYALLDNIEIVGSISMADRTQAALLVEKSWDYLLVFEQNSRPFLTAMFHFLNIPDERIIYAQDMNSWVTHPAAVLALVSPQKGGGSSPRRYFFRRAEIESLHKLHNGGRLKLYCHFRR